MAPERSAAGAVLTASTVFPRLWPTSSFFTNPGTASFHSAQVRIGIGVFEQCSLLHVRPAARIKFRPAGLSRRSIVAGAIVSSSAGVASSMTSLPFRDGTPSGRFPRVHMPEAAETEPVRPVG